MLSWHVKWIMLYVIFPSFMEEKRGAFFVKHIIVFWEGQLKMKLKRETGYRLYKQSCNLNQCRSLYFPTMVNGGKIQSY